MSALGRAAAFSSCLLLVPCLSGCGAAFAAAAQLQRTPEQVAAIEAWKVQINRQLESKKQYPAAARSRREQGVVLILFRLDRQEGSSAAELSEGLAARRSTMRDLHWLAKRNRSRRLLLGQRCCLVYRSAIGFIRFRAVHS